MRSGLTLFLALYSGVTLADACDVQTAQVVEATGAKYDHRSPSGENVFFSYPNMRTFTVACPEKGVFGPGNVAMSMATAFPPKEYFDLVARTAATSLKVSAAEVRRLAVQCHKAALATSEESAEASSKVVHIECSAFRRDGGGTLMTVWPPRKD